MRHPVYLVRHGESSWNRLRLTQGQTAHPPLTELGRDQAAAAADRIARDLAALALAVDRIVSSDLARAAETAGILAARLGGEVTLDPRLREQHLGDLEGRSYDETWAAAEAIDWSDPTQPIGGGESLLDVHERMAAAVDDVDPRTVTVLVSHGDAIRGALAHLAGVRPHESDWVDVPNGAVARIADGVVWL